MSGLSLKTAASFFRDDVFSSWNSTTNQFEDEFKGRLFRIDRFKTIYDRPTKRQKLTYDNTVSLDGVLAVRRESDQGVFLVSATPEQEYWDGVQNYDNVVTVHRAMAPSGGLGTYLEAETRGIDEDLGVVELTERGQVYIDMEFRSSEDEPATSEVAVPLMNVFFTSNVAPVNGDYFLVGDRYFLIQAVEFDSGFSFCRVRQQDSTYKNGIYYQRPDMTATYNTADATVTPPQAFEREFSFIPGVTSKFFDPKDNRYDNTTTIFVYQDHIGFEPNLGDSVITFGNTAKVIGVEFSPLEEQWKITLSG